MQLLKNWFQERQSQFELKIKARAEAKGSSRTYIIPTRFGFSYALTCFLLLLIAVIYQNNLVFLSMFSLVGIGLHCMYLTNSIVQKVVLQFHSQSEFFVSETQEARFVLQAQEKKVEFHLSATGGKATTLTNEKKSAQVAIPLLFQRRGQQKLPVIRVSSEWPLGFFHSWKWVAFDESILVFPEKKGEFPFPHGFGDQHGRQKFRSQENFNGFRLWHEGISYRLIDWRIYGRLKQFMYADFSSAKGMVELQFSLPALLEKLPLEKAISQLTTWIEKAHSQRYSYQLDLGTWKSAMQSSNEHRIECLTRLAEWQ